MKDMEEPPVGTVVVARRKDNGDWLGAKNTDVGWRITIGGYAAIRWADLLSMTDIVAVYLPNAKSGTDADSLRVGTVPRGGRTGQFLVKMSDDDYDTAWVAPPYVPEPVLGPGGGPLRATSTVSSGNVRAWLAQEADEAEAVAEQQVQDDRLRRAADRVLWDSTFLRESDFPELQNERRQKERVAGLLRVVADTHRPQPGEPDDPCSCPEHLAALALADAILGRQP